MLNRNVSLAVCLSIIAGAAFAQSSNQGTGYIFEFANTSANSGQFQAFIYNAQSLGTPAFTAAGPAGADQVIAKPDGSKFYVVGTAGVDDFNPTFSTPAAVNGIAGTPNPGQSIITPDGRYLLVPASQGGGGSVVYVLNTTTDAVALSQTFSGSVIAIVASRDSQTAWILGQSAGQTVITVLNLPAQGAPQQVGSPVFLRDPISGANLAGNAQSMALSPLGLLYVGAGNAIVEIVPSTLTTGALNGGIFPNSISPPTQIQLLATPGTPQFSADGTMMYFINTTPSTGGKSLFSVTLPGHVVNSWPSALNGQQPELFDSILVASPTRLFAHSPNDTTLWDVAPDFSTVGVSALNSVLPATEALSIALSDELPTARYLFVLAGSGTQATLDRVDLTTNTVNSQASAALGSGTLQFSIVPPESNPTAFLQYNATQTGLAAQAVAAPLIARVLDPTGRPMFGVPVSFTGDPSLTFSNVSATSNEDGYVQATVTLGSTPGSYPVTLTAGTGTNVATTTFTLVIPGGSVGPTGGPNQMTIISGNGQLFRSDFGGFGVPLAVQLLDTNGNPLVNQSVTFTVAGLQLGYLDNPNATTDNNGMASTDFYPQNIAQNTPFQSTNVTAVATQGAVTFTETVWQPDSTETQPTATVLVPNGTQTFTAGEGDVVPGAIVAIVSAHAFGSNPVIPNVALNITAPDGSGNPGPGTCQGNPLTDVTGTVTCNFVASCSAGLGIHGFFADFGEAIDIAGYSVNIVPGSSRALVIESGNNSSGGPGATIPLTARVTDQCGTASQGVTVTWQVVQGSATLSTSSTVSNQGGNVSTSVTLGQAAGTVQIVASINSSTSVTFSENVQTVVGSLKLVSGGGQTALENQVFPTPLVFQVSDSKGNPIPGLVVNFSLGGGSASISTTSATTNANGQVSVNVTAGNAAGAVTITATYSTFTASAGLTVTAPGPGVTLSSFVNAASGQGGLTPCGLALVTGSGLATSVSGVMLGNTLGIGPLPYTLAGVTITINGTPAPLQAVSNQNGIQQVNFQTPCELVTGSPATVVVQVGSVSTQVTGVTVYPAQPGVFTYAGPSGINYGYVIDSNGNALTPSNLAQAGKTYYLFATGLGAVPGVTTDSEGTNQTLPASSVTLAINNTPVTVNSVQYLQGALGEYLIAFTIPVPFGTGTNLPLALGMTVNGQTFYDNSPVALPGIH